MIIFRYFSGITAPVITGYHADIKRDEQHQQFVPGFIGSWPEGISQNIAGFGVVSTPEPVCRALLPLNAISVICSLTRGLRASEG